MKLHHLLSLAFGISVGTTFAQVSTSTDLWDTSQGAVITAISDVHPAAGTAGGLLGDYGQNNGDPSTWTYFADGKPADFVHYVEWETPVDVTVGQVRVFAFGDDASWNYGREFAQFTLKAKSPGSSTYDLTVLTFTPTHPYSFVDWTSALLIDQAIAPVTARSFRAEFLQYTAGLGYDGPRILEIDGLPVPVPSVATDVWDVTQGAVVTASSGLMTGAGSPAGLFGENGQNNHDGSTWTYFADGQPADFVHFIEWETPTDVTVGEVRLFAIGDGGFGGNAREFAQFTLKTKSPGSSTFDVTVLTFTPNHPYRFLDPDSLLILDQTISPITGRSFRAEFLQYTVSGIYDGPRIVEIDGIAGIAPPPPPPVDPPPVDPPPALPPVIGTQPQSIAANFASPVELSVAATGTTPLQYQWFKDSNPLPAETGLTLRIASLSSSDAGTYRVNVTDVNGTTQSAEATVSLDLVNILPSSFDLWDSHSGATISAHSDYASIGTPYGMFGGGLTDDSSITYFADNQPAGTVHSVEWITSAPVQVNTIRLFAHGDGLNFANTHEFKSFTLRAMSSGSTTFDILIGTFTPTHPYALLDETTFAILDTEIAPVEATAFRAEFEQFTAGSGLDGPRIVELDAFTTRPMVVPAIVVSPQSQTVAKRASVTFSVLARGGNLQYQWKHNGLILPGQTSDSLTIANAKHPDQGSYTVVVSNSLGSVESSPAILTVPNK